MNRNTFALAGIASLAIAGGSVPAIIANIQVPASELDSLVENADVIFPRVQIIDFGTSVGRLNTRTGALFLFDGDLNAPNVRGNWRLEAPAVRERSSGFLDIQQAGGGIFLVDLVNGRTWVLRDRGLRSEWHEINVLGQ